MSRRTEYDYARDVLANLNNRAFRICESVPKEDASYLEGYGAKEWTPIDDRRALKLLVAILLTNGDQP